LRPLGIKASLGLVQLLVASACIVAGLYSVHGLTTVNNRMEEINSKSLASIKAIGPIDELLRTFYTAETEQLAATTADTLQTQSALSDAVAQEVTDTIDAYAPLVHSEREKALYSALKDRWTAYKTDHAETFRNWSATTERTNAIAAGSRLRDLEESVSTALAALSTFNTEQAVTYAQDSRATYQTTLWRVYYAYAALFAVMVLSGVVVIYNILRPLQAINILITRLAGGDTQTSSRFANRRDEIGAIAASLDVFRAGIIEKHRLEQEAETQRERAEADRLAIQTKAEADATQRLHAATGGLATGLRRMAGGDLSFQIDSRFSAEFEPLRHDFNQSLEQLAATFSQMSDGVHTIHNGTQELATGADHLAHRTETQAASLEQTAAALTQITDSVAQAAQRSEEARQIGTQARDAAATSARIAHDTETSMQHMESGSAEIVSIVDVIDGIAFQTNVLALNASVEAARAGDVGRGFAVVASEVRALAQRSSEAARDIRRLIQKTVSDVKEGSERVRESSQTLRTITEFISQIASHLDAIALSAAEQSSSLAAINTTVTQLDRTTQQNAAMGEEFNATSRSLAMETQKLNELVRQFLLPDQTYAQQAPALSYQQHG
jgi:methyl-accepting chemotaxis protein